jgi:hypothetical protein
MPGAENQSAYKLFDSKLACPRAATFRAREGRIRTRGPRGSEPRAGRRGSYRVASPHTPRH